MTARIPNIVQAMNNGFNAQRKRRKELVLKAINDWWSNKVYIEDSDIKDLKEDIKKIYSDV